jgi:hypothetical protein
VRRASPLALTCLDRTGCPLQYAAAYMEEWQVLPPPARAVCNAGIPPAGGGRLLHGPVFGRWQLAVGSCAHVGRDGQTTTTTMATTTVSDSSER